VKSNFLSVISNASEDRDLGAPQGERDFDRMVENALSDEAKKKIMGRLCKKCCAKVTFILKIGKDRLIDAPIKQAVKPHGFEPGNTYTEVKPCPAAAN
jgi:hypothetical protein